MTATTTPITTPTRLSPMTVVPFDLYRDIHKAIRTNMFQVTADAGRVDPGDRGACLAAAHEVLGLVGLLQFHAEHEDNHIESLVAAILPELAAEIAADHAAFDARAAELASLADRACGQPDMRAAMHVLYIELASFVSAYLAHQDLEEHVVMPTLWAAYGFDPLLAVHNTIVGSIPPAELADTLLVMLPAMNNDDRTELLGGMKAGAPAEAFAEVLNLAAQALSEKDFAIVTARVDLAMAAAG